MSLVKIFEWIRQEKLVLWAGSGLSKYAGYPTGKELSAIIYQSLSRGEQQEIESSLSLADMTEQFIRIKEGNRNPLNVLLRDVFSKSPSSLKFHQIIANMPHIKTVITTNYDNLFEQAYGNKILKILSPSDVGKIDGRTELFKIHGDLGSPESVIISKSDYAKFFFNNENLTLYWSVMAERISNKAILFLGYDMEDDNVNNFLDKVWSELKENRKEIFLIAPRLQKNKVTHLHQKGVMYIDSKAEIFLEKLLENIKENIVADFEKQLVSVETLQQFLLKNKLSVDLAASKSKLKISAIKPTSPEVKGNIRVSLKNDELLQQKFSKLIHGEEFDEMELDKNTLNDFKMSMNGINILGNDIKEFKFVFKSTPAKKGMVNVVFEDGFELNDIEYEIFASAKQIQITAKYKRVSLSIKFSKKDFEEKKTCDISIAGESFEHSHDAINTCQFLDRFSAGKKFHIYPEIPGATNEFGAGFNEDYNKEVKKNLEFYELLKKVETAYKIKCKNITLPTNELFHQCTLALNAVAGTETLVHSDGNVKFDLSEEQVPLDVLVESGGNGIAIGVQSSEQEIFNIYGEKINLGYRETIYSDLFIVNLEKILRKEETVVRLRSKSQTATVVYVKKKLHDAG
ncbi:MAG TPA: SIR2 family protein [Puia sp.]|nr:SIR2 family protein [Puia sp.]